MRLKGKIAIVTGGSRGIGRAIALCLADEGAVVVVAARTETEIKSVCSEVEQKGNQALAVKTDVTNVREVNSCINATMKQFGRIDILVNCAGSHHVSSVIQSDEKKWKMDFEGKVFGTYNFCKATLKIMISQRDGRIINVSSRTAKSPIPLFSSYCASNAAIIGFTKSLALEVATYNINVNAVCPALVETKMLDESINRVSAIKGVDFGTIKSRLKEDIPIKRFVTPKECGRLVVFLVSDDARAITAQAINISGGLETH